MSLSIIKAGAFDTLQDAGRYGYGHWGINPNGVMDIVAARMANSLAGNKDFEVVLEMHYPAPVLRCGSPAIICLTGADFTPQVNGVNIPLYTPIMLQAGDVLSFERPQKGRVAYLARQGGFAATEWLGSASTHVKLGQGGFHGRTLQKGDELTGKQRVADWASQLPSTPYVFSWQAHYDYHNESKIFVLPGKEWDQLTESSKSTFAEGEFTISRQSDRMGFGLIGEKLVRKDTNAMVSSAVQYGTLQLLPNGQMIVLMADHQTIGGYPRVAQVIAAHRSRLAQCVPGATVQFELVDTATAEQLLLEQEAYLQQLHSACLLKWEEVSRKNKTNDRL